MLSEFVREFLNLVSCAVCDGAVCWWRLVVICEAQTTFERKCGQVYLLLDCEWDSTLPS